MFTGFTFGGNTVVIDSVQFVSINNLPCNLCWATTSATNTFAAGVDGCILVSGTTNDAVGQYKLALALNAWYNHNATPQSIPAGLVDQTGTRLFVRVKSSGGGCAAVDTATGSSANLTANPAHCAGMGVNNLANSFTAVNILPNPMSSGALLSFDADRSGTFSFKITNLAGQVVRTKDIKVREGANNLEIERGNLAAGMYILSITDGKSKLTRKFSVID